MLDVETFSTAPNATIVSLGAVKFDPYDSPGSVLDVFHVGINPALSPLQVQHLFAIDPATINWWLSSDRAAAREAMQKLEAVDIGTALAGFASWFGERKPVWGNAASFDCVIVEQNYRLLGLDCPWRYPDHRCYRTMKQLAPNAPKPADRLTHDALQDALWQAEHLQGIMAELGIAPTG